MVYRARDIKHLETMKTLEEMQPQEIDVKNLLFSDASEGPSFEQDILKLCTGLRTGGFDKLAAALEDKFIAFKQAEVHLYRVHDEDGDDLIEFAHPEGDTNMGDNELGDVETIVSKHKKIVDILGKKPTGKLASYVEQCKIALAWDDNENAELIKKYKSFAEDFGNSLNSVAVSLDSFQNAKLPNGKSVSEYNLKGMALAIKSFAAGGDVRVDWPTSKIIERTDGIVKEVYELIDQIDKAIDNGSTEFTNPKFPDEAWAALNPSREEFLSIYSSYNKDQDASEWHGQFASTEQIDRVLQPIKEKFTSLTARIDRHVLGEPTLKNAPAFLKWFESVKQTSNRFLWELNNVSYEAKKFQDSMMQLHKGGQALIDGNKLREFLQQSNSGILNVDGVDKSTNNATKFLVSLNVAYNTLLTTCKQSIQNANIDQATKAAILKHFEA